MNPRRVAALALVGWYLMLLPKNDPTVGVFPVSWSATQGSFDAAKDCEAARAKAVVPPSSPAQSAKSDQLAYFCIATDDPRLKGTGVR